MEVGHDEEEFRGGRIVRESGRDGERRNMLITAQEFNEEEWLREEEEEDMAQKMGEVRKYGRTIATFIKTCEW